MAPHICSTCGVEMPSPGGLAVHEMRHLATPPPPRPAAPVVAKPGKAPKGRGRHGGEQGLDEEPHKGRRRGLRSVAGQEIPGPRRRRRRSRAMSSGGHRRLLQSTADSSEERYETPSDALGRSRVGLDSTVPLTALLVVAALIGGVAAAMTHSPKSVSLVTGDNLVAAGATSGPEPVDAALETAAAACRPVIDALVAPSAARATDLGDLMRKGSFPIPPVAGFEKPAVTGPSRYDSVGEYLAAAQVVDPVLWHRKLSSSGFRTAASVTMKKGTQVSAAVVLQFGSAAGAADFNRSSLSAVCAAGKMTGAQPIGDVAGGLTYVSSEPGNLPHRASVVIGDSVAHLSVCECIEAPDRQALVGAWARALVTQVNAV